LSKNGNSCWGNLIKKREISMNENEKSIKQVEEYRNKAYKAQELEDLLQAAQWYLRAEDFGEAAKLYEIKKEHEKAAECYFKNQEYIAAAHNYKKIGNDTLASEMFELAREFNKAAHIAYKHKNYQRAGELYERARNYFKAGRAYFLSKDYKNSLLNLEIIKEGDPDYSDALIIMAKIFLFKKNPNQVTIRIENFLKGKSINHSNIDCYVILARAYEELKNFARASYLYRKIEEFDPNNKEIKQKTIELKTLVNSVIEIGNNERYRKDGLIGVGGMGRVFRAEDLKLHRMVALKILEINSRNNHHDIERFEAEARKIAQLNHPNIVTLFDSGKMNGDYFISMELIEGESLETIIEGKKSLSIFDILMISKRLFKALDYSHNRGVIHRDIKPGNIMITYNNYLKIVDFGIAVLKEELNKKDNTVNAGTPHYMSPEQIEGRPLNHRTDIYSAGITMFQMLTGDVPFKGSHLEIYKKHLEDPLPSIKKLRNDTPEKLIQIIEICTAKGQEKRYQSARHVVKDIERVRDNNGKPFLTYKSKLDIFKETKETDETSILNREVSNTDINSFKDNKKEESRNG